jgi:hydrogenase maturation protein HypF
LSDEPICTDEKEALERLRGIADLFLVHDRPIVRHVDDSIARIMCGRELVLRRARGYAPLPVTLRRRNESKTVLAVGAHLKNAVALAVGPQVFVSQHIGDLETEQAHNAFTRVLADFLKLYQARPETIACDAHPDYLSTQFAVEKSGQNGGPALERVQHHLAHVLSCMAENDLEPPVLGVAWDGTGYGLDESIWGGEFFKVTSTGSERMAHLRPFPLPGGEQAIKEPRRSALGLLYELWGETLFSRSDVASLRAFTTAELTTLKAMLAREVNSPRTSSVGRLFDAVASLAGLRQQTRFEGQAAMELEFALESSQVDDCYSFTVAEPTQQRSALVLDWGPAVEALLLDLKEGVPLGRLSAKFHNGLIESIISVARKCGLERVALSGGCFQNRYLTERTVRRLREEGFRPYWHQRVPPNDGGIALGQIVAALRSFVP